MASYSYSLTPLAESDLDGALGYISGELASPGAASKLYRDVLRALGEACGMPYSSPDCSRYLVADPAYRCRLVGNYLLVYRVDDAGRRIEVLRFLYARRDIGADAIGRASAGD